MLSRSQRNFVHDKTVFMRCAKFCCDRLNMYMNKTKFHKISLVERVTVQICCDKTSQELYTRFVLGCVFVVVRQKQYYLRQYTCHLSDATFTVGQRKKVTAVTFFRCPTVTLKHEQVDLLQVVPVPLRTCLRKLVLEIQLLSPNGTY